MLETIVSGGQDGVDVTAWVAALAYGLKTEGYMPKGFKTSSGNKFEYASKYGAIETKFDDYPFRTRCNVVHADATLRIAWNFNSPGELCTLRAIKSENKSYFDVDMNDPCDPNLVAEWIRNHNIRTLNVAGNRCYGERVGEVYSYLSRVFEALGLVEEEVECE